MKIALLSLTLFALAAHAAPTSLRCFETDANGDAVKDSNFTFVIQGKTIQSANFFGYEVVRDGTVRDESAIGHDVFNVSVSKVTNHFDGLQTFSVALQDYSDIRSWDITVSPEAGEAVVLAHFQSSDGDNLPHVSSSTLKCE